MKIIPICPLRTRKIKIFLQTGLLFFWAIMIDTLPTYAKTSGEVNILLGDTNEAPYSELAPGRILSTFNAAVLGQLIKTDQNYNLIPGHLESWNWDFHTSEYVLKMRPGLKFHNGKPASFGELGGT